MRFVGANGFCGAAYTTLLRALARGSQRVVRAIDVPLAAPPGELEPWVLGDGVTVEVSRRGRAAAAATAAAAGVTLQSWRPMVEELVAATAAQVAVDGRPVVGVGHSFGGALLCAAGAAAPHLWERLVLFDPPLFSPAKRLAMGVAQAAGLMGAAFPPAARAARKTARYDSRAAAVAALRGKPFFATLNAGCREDFFTHALVDCSGSGGGASDSGASSDSACVLAFPPALEAAIYRTTPVDVAPFVAPALASGAYACRVPTVCVFAAPRMRLANALDVAWLQRAMPPQWRFVQHGGDHFWPLSDPSAAAVFVDAQRTPAS